MSTTSSVREEGDETGEESETGCGVLVDWNCALSTKSAPTRGQRRIEQLGRNAISLYDSDSSDDTRNQPKRASLLAKLTSTFDEEESVEDGMILTDDEEVEEDDELEKWRQDRLDSTLKPLSATPSTIHHAPVMETPTPAPTPTAETPLTERGMNRERGAMAAIFMEDKPWRRRGADDGDFMSSVPKPVRAIRSISNPLKLLQDRKKTMRSKSLTVDQETETHTTTPNNDGTNDLDETSSEEEDYDELDEFSILASQLPPIDLDEGFEWDGFSSMPNSFLGSGQMHASMTHYLDEQLQNANLSKKEADRFVLEHSLILRAILQLLAERDGIQDWEDASLILKQGSLKKLSSSGRRQNWKFKYVEVRQGFFSFYEDGATQQSRKTIPLADCDCNAVDGKPGQFIFELVTENAPKRLWMTSSEDERQSWIRVITKAKQGEKRGPINLEPYQDSLARFHEIQTNLRWSVSKSEYMFQFGDVDGLRLEIPLGWIQNQDHVKNNAPVYKNNTADFWKFLTNHAVLVNGHQIPAESTHSPERSLGALSRCILEYDRSSLEEHAQRNMTEAQALSYARNILIAVWKSRGRDDAYAALDALCRNANLVIVLPGSSDPRIHVNVTYTTGEDLVEVSPDPPPPPMQISGWVTTRSKSFKPWKNRFCIVADGVLSYYEHASPRPHGLRGQLVLVGATINSLKEKNLHIVQIFTKDQERVRQLSFRDEAVFLEWKEGIQRAIDACSASMLSPPQSPGRRRKNARRILKENGGRIIKGGVEGGFKAIKGASDLIVRGIRKNQTGRRPSLSTMWTHEAAPKQEPPSVQVAVESHRTYKIMTADPCGVESKDTWLTVQTKTYQLFKLSGGEHGRISPGDEIAVLKFIKGLAGDRNGEPR